MPERVDAPDIKLDSKVDTKIDFDMDELKIDRSDLFENSEDEPMTRPDFDLDNEDEVENNNTQSNRDKEIAEQAAKDKADKELAEQVARDKADKEFAEQAARDKADREFAEQAAKEKAEEELDSTIEIANEPDVDPVTNNDSAQESESDELADEGIAESIIDLSLIHI